MKVRGETVINIPNDAVQMDGRTGTAKDSEKKHTLLKVGSCREPLMSTSRRSFISQIPNINFSVYLLYMKAVQRWSSYLTLTKSSLPMAMAS